MTLKEKLELEQSGEPLIRLYKEGIFFVAYNHSALRFKHFFCPQVKLLKHQSKNADDYIRAGVVQDSPMLQSFPLKDNDGNWLSSVVLDCDVIQTSLEDVIPDKIVRRDNVSLSKKETKKRESVPTVHVEIVNEILGTDTGCLTPVQALVLIDNWKKKLVTESYNKNEGI